MKSDYISDLIIIALLCVGYIYINNRISEYQGETYLWKKLLGESEKKIIIEFKKKNILVESLFLLVFAVINISGDILNWLISIINIVILINNMLLLMFRRKYCRNISGKIFMIIAYIYFIWIFFTVIQAIVAGGEVYAIVIRIVKTKCIGLGAYGRRRGQRTRIRFGIGRIGNYRNIVLHCVFRHFKFNRELGCLCRR